MQLKDTHVGERKKNVTCNVRQLIEDRCSGNDALVVGEIGKCRAGGRICRGESIREMARAPKDECSGDGVCLRQWTSIPESEKPQVDSSLSSISNSDFV